jgi:hypothetical protein
MSSSQRHVEGKASPGDMWNAWRPLPNKSSTQAVPQRTAGVPEIQVTFNYLTEIGITWSIVESPCASTND